MHLKEGLEKMGDEIKGAFVRDNALHFVKGSQIMQVTDNGKEPDPVGTLITERPPDRPVRARLRIRFL